MTQEMPRGWTNPAGVTTVGKPSAGEPHARVERGMGKLVPAEHRAPDYQ